PAVADVAGHPVADVAGRPVQDYGRIGGNPADTPGFGGGSAQDCRSHASRRAVVAEACGVSHGYRSVSGEVVPVIRDLDLTLRDGDRVALIGGNGAGKTTLMRLLAG